MQLRMRLTTAQLRIGDQYYKHKSITAKSFLSNFAQVIFKMCLFGLHMRVGFNSIQFVYFSPQTSQNNAVNIMIKITSMEKKGIQN
jgi:hypothetical protein